MKGAKRLLLPAMMRCDVNREAAEMQQTLHSGYIECQTFYLLKY
jgi:hypothetical protein